MSENGWPLSVQTGGAVTGAVAGVTVMTRATGDDVFQPLDPSTSWSTETDGPAVLMHQVKVAWPSLPARSVAMTVNVCEPASRPV